MLERAPVRHAVRGTTMLLGTLLCAAAAASDHARAQLRYHVPAELAACPDQAEFQRRVAQQLGYDPFASGEGTAVSLEVQSDARALHGRLEVSAGEPAEPAVRELSEGLEACDALVSALASTLALSLDPLAATVPRPGEPPAPAQAVVVAAPVPAPPVLAPQPQAAAPSPARRVPAAREPVRGFAAVGGGLSVGLVPGLALYGSGSLGMRVHAFALELEGRADSSVKGERVDERHRVEATTITGGLVPCMHGSFYAGCLTVRMGALQGRATGVSEPRLGSSFLGTLGVALRLELPERRGFRVRIGLDAALPLVRTELVVNGQVAWTAPPVYGALSLALHVPLW